MKDKGDASILIVDDVGKNIQLVAKFLTGDNYYLFYAKSGEAALKQIETRRFDLILLDIMMPEMDGYEVCRRIKLNPSNKTTPIIFLTARIDNDAINKGFACGGVDYITKPFNPEELVARVKIHIQLQKREQELTALNRTKDKLLSVIGHDLKTPFHNVKELGELILDDFDHYTREEIKFIISNIVDSAAMSQNLLENLFNWVRIQSGEIKYKPQRTDLENLIQKNIGFIKSLLLKKNMNCSFQISEQLFVLADENMLDTILRNTLSNAVKFTSAEGKISIVVTKENENARIEISDSGVGMSEDMIRTFFDNAYIESRPGTDDEIGSGFGLVVTNDFIRINKGSISVKSRIGEGTTFTIMIPLFKG